MCNYTLWLRKYILLEQNTIQTIQARIATKSPLFDSSPKLSEEWLFSGLMFFHLLP